MAEVESRWPEEVRVRLRTNHGSNRIYDIWRRTFLAGEFDHLWPFLDPAKAAVDVGALLGQYSLTLSAFSTRCLCIEPLEQYRFLAEVLPPNCILRTVATGARRGSGIIYSPVAPDGSVDFGLSSLVRTEWPQGYTLRAQETEIRSLDEVVSEALGNEPVGFIKIDVEDYELEVLGGATETLARHRPALQVEVHARQVGPVRELMARLGFRGLFFYQRRLLDLSEFRAHDHRAPENLWAPERRESYDPDLVASDVFFIPVH